MRRILLVNLTIFCFLCTIDTFGQLPVYKDPKQPIDSRVEDLLSRMTLEEKLGQLNMPDPPLMARDSAKSIDAMQKFAVGKLVSHIGPAGGFFGACDHYRQGPGRQAEMINSLQKLALEQTRLQIPLLFVEEGTHGVMAPGSTIFPEGLALGSTWNMDLIRDVYSAVGKEARSRGVHQLGTLVIEPNRDPRMGRNQEGYSEDPYLCSCIASALVTGMQGDNIASPNKAIAELCHYPGQSQPVSGLERGAMEISERILREVFLPSWVAGIKKSGALGVMATYPSIDGQPAHVSEKLLTKILREELGFQGLVLCEGEGLKIPIYEKIAKDMKESGAMCLKAGVDVSIWFEDGYLEPMYENVNEGKVSMETIDRSVRRILKIKFMLGLFENPYVDTNNAEKSSNTKENRDLALQAAREGIVLLKNEKNILPLNKNIKSIAVIGPNADSKINQFGDYAPRFVMHSMSTVLDGIKKKVSPTTRIRYVKGCEIDGDKPNQLKEAADAAKSSDLAIVVVGENRHTDGEPCDVYDLNLTGLQEQLVETVQKTGTPTIVILINGRALSITWINKNIPGIIDAWNCGERGGDAVADVLFGDYNPGGKLPVSFPKHV
jgi:beta-glucosidase